MNIFWPRDLWPMTLTYQLDLDIHALDLHAKIQVGMSVCSLRRAWQTDKQCQNYYTWHVTDVGRNENAWASDVTWRLMTRPMTLTFELIWDIIKVNPSTKFWVRTSNGSVVRVLNYRQTDTHTRTHSDGTDFMPSTADMGGKNRANCYILHFTCLFRWYSTIHCSYFVYAFSKLHHILYLKLRWSAKAFRTSKQYP